MNDRDHVSEEELNAYVDNELPADRRSVVEAWLSTHPDDAARVAAWRKQSFFVIVMATWNTKRRRRALTSIGWHAGALVRLPRSQRAWQHS